MKCNGNILYLIRYAAVAIILAKLMIIPVVFADTASTDWRTDYKLMVQAYYANDYDKATDCAQTQRFRNLC